MSENHLNGFVLKIRGEDRYTVCASFYHPLDGRGSTLWVRSSYREDGVVPVSNAFAFELL
jgi:hypothetical protein